MTWKINQCEVSKDLIDLYLDGTISDQDRKIVENHLPSCENCTSYVQFQSELKSLLQSDEMKPSSNPFLYSNLMTRIDGISKKPQLSGFKIAFAGTFIAALIVVVSLPLFTSDTNQQIVKHSSGLVGASPQTHYLVSDLSESDILFFWKEEALPLDQNKNEYVILDQQPGSKSSLIFTGSNCKNCIDIDVIKTVAVKMNLSKESLSGIESVINTFADDIRSYLLIDRSGQLLINSSIFGINSKLSAALAEILDSEKFGEFQMLVFESFEISPNRVNSAFTIDLPKTSDKVIISDENPIHYSLIAVDQFTARSLRQSFPKLGRIISSDLEEQSLVNYKVVSKNEVLYASQEKVKSETIRKVKVQPETGGMSIIEANRLMTAMKSGMSPDEIIAYKAEFEKYLKDYSKLSQEVRTQYYGKENEEAFKVYIPQSDKISVVGFGNEPQQTSRKTKKTTATISIDHP